MKLMPPRSRLIKYKILAVDLEPTPYKTDLWNAFSDSKIIEIYVIYTEKKNWSPDGGHNYLKWPTYRHGHVILSGKGIFGALRSALFVATRICTSKLDLIYISGYDHFSTVVALIISIILRKKFVLHSDEFNNSRPKGRLVFLKWVVREILRKVVFKYGEAVLVCGRRGMETALLAGCKEHKILDFPYVIDVDRLKRDAPEVIPNNCLSDVEQGTTIILFSGRMIPRKGLPTLLAALSEMVIKNKWILWIEGEGPELRRYEALAQEYGVHDRCRFLGFCQYDLHSWLIRSAEIVVVPSLVDTWGIVVDEAIQLGKVVISSDATGSGYDRIENGHNGFIFPAGNVKSLANILNALLNDKKQVESVRSAAKSGAGNLRPADNLETLLKLMK